MLGWGRPNTIHRNEGKTPDYMSSTPDNAQNVEIQADVEVLLQSAEKRGKGHGC